MPSSNAERNPVEQLAEEFAERQRRGENPAIGEYTAKYPQWAEQIRDLFPALVLMEQLKPVGVETTGAYQGPALAPGETKKLERLGDFRILREVGRGGMGIVYEAEQESLGRHVALKVLPSHALLDPRQLQRFRREARAAGRLHHTNIVPVYGVGAEEGLHYYVMQFINGLGLEKVLGELKRLRRPAGAPASGEGGHPPDGPASRLSAADVARSLLTGHFPAAAAEGGEGQSDAPSPAVEITPTPAAPPAAPPGSPPAADAVPPSLSTLSESGRHYFVSVARIGLQVAEALAYAHGQGTLHRDIKPSNLLLDTQGTVWVTDFGLARAVADSDQLTQSGDIVGTLRYMAPERFLGQSDARGDIYGLGLTLYELLALRPPYDETDRNGLIYQITHKDTPPLRQIDPHIPHDLETIVLKALAREPAHRYQTAADLAEDLKRFVEDRPIRARRVSQLERLWRWCRRNPALAGLTATALFLLATVAVVATAAYAHTSAALRREQQAQGDAADARESARRARLQEQEAKKGAQRQQNKAAEARQRYKGYFTDLTRNYLGRGLLHCGKGEVDQGLLWLARSLQVVPDSDRPLEEGIRANLAAWSPRLPVSSLRHPSWIAYVATSPDGKMLATACNQEVWRWDAATGQPVGKPLQAQSVLSFVGFTSDGKTMIAGGQMEVRFWDAATGEPRGEPLRFEGNSYSVLYSPDGRTAVRTGWNAKTNAYEVQLGNLATRQPVGEPLSRSGPYTLACQYSPDGKALLSLGNQEAQLWDPATAAPLGQPFSGVQNAAFGADGKTLLLNLYNRQTGRYEVQLVDLPSRALIGKPLPAHGYVMAVSPDRRRIVTSSGQLTQLWDPATGQAVGRPLEHRSQGQAIMGLAFSPDGKVVLTRDYQEIRLWSAATGAALGEPLRVPGQCYSTVFSPDGQLLLSTSYGNPPNALGRYWGELQLWKLADRLGRPLSHPAAVTALALAGPGFVVAGRDGTASLRDLATGKPLGLPFRHAGAVTALALSADGKVLLTGSEDRTAQLWDVATRRPLGQPLRHAQGVRAVALNSDGTRALTGCADGTAQFWDRQGKALGPPLRHPGPVLAVAFSSDGRTALTGCADGKVRSWDVTTGKPRGPTLVHKGPVRAVAFGRRDRAILTGSEDHTARLWSSTTGKPLGQPLPHPAPVHAAAWSPDGRLVLTACRDGAARLWHAATGTLVGPELSHLDGVNAAVFSPDGRAILTGCDDHTARLWKVRPPERGSEERIALWVQTVTGTRLGTDDRVEALDEATRAAQRQRLKVLDVSPRDARSWKERGRLYASLGEWARAVADFTRALDRSRGDPELWHERGQAYARQKEWSRALADYSRALRGRPGATPWWAERGRIRIQLRDWSGAVRDFTTALRKRPDDPDLYAERGESHLRLRAWEQAAADLARSLELYPEGSQQWRNTCLLVLGREKVFAKVAALRPRDARLWIERGRFLGRRDHWRRAVAAFSRAIELRPDDAELRRERGQAHVQRRQWDEAAADFHQALELLPANAPQRAGLYDPLIRSEKLFSRAAALRPKDPLLWRVRGVARARAGRWKEAAADLTEALQRVAGPDGAVVLTQRGQAYAQQGLWKEAGADFARALEQQSNNPSLYAQLAQSDHAFAEVARLRPQDARLWLQRARFRTQRGQWGPAGADLAQALDILEKTKSDPRAVVQDLLQQEMVLEKALALRPRDGFLWRAQGDARARKSQWGEAAAAYGRARELNPDRVELGHKQACTLLAAGRAGEYRRLCRRLLERFGRTTDANTASWVARTCALAPDATGDPARVVQLAKQGLAGQPSRGASLAPYLRTLASAHYRAGQYAEAVQRLREAILEGRVEGPDAAVLDWLWLALAHYRLDHKERARRFLTRFDEMVRGHGQRMYQRYSVQAVTLPLQDQLEYPFLRDEAEALILPHLHWQKRARAHIARKEWAEAADALSKAIQAAPAENVDLLRERGLVYLSLARWQAAGDDFARVLERQPNHAAVRKEVVQREQVFTRVAALRPSDAGLWVARGNFLAERALWKEAAAAFARVVTLQADPNGSMWHKHAALRLVIGDTRGYRQACATILAAYPRTPDWKGGADPARAVVVGPGGLADYAQPVAWARQAATLSGHHGWVNFTLGLARYRAGKSRQAIAELQESLKISPTWDARALNWAVLALAHHRLGDRKEAREWLEKTTQWIDQANRDSAGKGGAILRMPWWDWVELQLLHREARTRIEGKAPPPDPYDQVYQGRGRAALAQPRRALACFTRAVELQPKSAALRLERGRFHAGQGEWEKAATDFETALGLLPEDPAERGPVYGEIGKWEKLQGVMLERRPRDGWLHVLRGRALLLRSQWADAEAAYARGIQSLPLGDEWCEYAGLRLLRNDDRGYRELCARILKERRRTDDPFTAYVASRICTLAPGTPADPAQAIRWAKQAVASSPRRTWYLHALGMAHLRAGEPRQAIERFQESLQAGPWEAHVLNWLGLALAEQARGQAREARQWLGKADAWLAQKNQEAAGAAVKVFPTDWPVFHLLHRQATKLLAEKRPALEQ
jgi:WD40 repeat protein/serine/threonine protein kinase/Flp pilus assembly protein TadD